MVTASIGDRSGKPRPFVVLRSERFVGHSLVTLLAITSALVEAPSLRIVVQPTAGNGLQLPSQAMIDHIQSVRLHRIGDVIGRVAEADIQAIDRAVAVYLGFADSPRRRRTVGASGGTRITRSGDSMAVPGQKGRIGRMSRALRRRR